MSMEKLSSCGTLVRGCDIMDSQASKERKVAEETKASIIAKIEAPNAD